LFSIAARHFVIAGDESVITAEEAKDVTAAGKRNAAGARASIPTSAAKNAAWKTIYEDEEISNEVLSAMVAGFMNLDQVELLSDFAEPYFESLPKIWKERSNEIAQTITTGLFPANQVTTEMIERTNRFLAEVEVPYGCVRQVSMGRDALVRALNAQAADK
jgi:aminopeptidase N